MSQVPHNADLPNDLLAFLRTGRQFEFEANESTIGHITLKRDTDLRLTTIATNPRCDSLIYDPYSDLDGKYQFDIYDLVASSEDYDNEGLLCWIVALKRFGCVDLEHDVVISFPDVTWADITASPLRYLDAQWGDSHHVARRVLPWIHFPFKLIATSSVIPPYGARCPVHKSPVTTQRVSKPRLFSVLRRHEIDDWLQNYLQIFPCSGVPVTREELLCCSECRAAEEVWLQRVDDSIRPMDASPNPDGWVKCPGCSIRFSLDDNDRFGDGVHLSCGQKIHVISNSAK